MVNNDRVALMTHLALYENYYGKESEVLQHYHKKDFIRLNSLKTFLISTLAFVLMLVLYFVITKNWILTRINDVDFKKLCIVIGIVYTIFIWVNVKISNLIMARRYENAKVRNARYARQIYELEQMYEDEQLASYVASKEKEMERNDPIISD